MAWKHRVDFIQIGPQTLDNAAQPVNNNTQTIDLNGMWKLTIYVLSPTKNPFVFEGVQADALYIRATSVGTANATVLEMGGAPTIDGLPVLMTGTLKVRFLDLCSFTLQREWLTNE